MATEIPTPEQYERYLEEQCDIESVKLKEYFSKLPKKKKQRLLGYFFDPDKIQAIYCDDIPPNSRKVLYNGDVSIESKSSVSEVFVEEEKPSPNTSCILTALFGNVFAAPVIKEYTATDVKKITFLGTSVTYTVSIKYRVINGKVKKICSGYATVDKFLVPNPITKISFSKFITQSNNMAHGEAIWEVEQRSLRCI